MHTHPHLHTRAHIHPITTDHGNTSLEISHVGLSAGVALALGPTSSRTKAWRQERDGSLGWISPKSEAWKRESEILGDGMETKTQSRMDAVHSV